ncbi:grasp-with-spasm system SPASM domain peptide maturase [Aquimarina rhabdastrellae]
MKKHFILFSNCILTKGANRSTITDLQKQQIHFLPNELHDTLVQLRTTPLNTLISEFDKNSQQILMDYINYFIDEGIGFYCKSPSVFPLLNLDFQSPEIINNAIIDLDKNSDYDIKNVIDQLIDLRCVFLEIRSYSYLNVDIIKDIIHHSSKGYFRNIDFILNYPKNENDIVILKKIILENPLIGKIKFHSAPFNSNDDFFNFSTKTIINNNYCGVINQKYFCIDTKVFSESQKHNTCLNKKISVDVNGYIKNCPSMKDSYGNIRQSSMYDILTNSTIKKNWRINKNKIDVCKDCEFRNICTDCRAFIENPTDIFSKPLKCGYNPYTNQWEEWSKNPIKQNAIKYYKLNI